jgi:hypothetical protein
MPQILLTSTPITGTLCGIKTCVSVCLAASEFCLREHTSESSRAFVKQEQSMLATIGSNQHIPSRYDTAAYLSEMCSFSLICDNRQYLAFEAALWSESPELSRCHWLHAVCTQVRWRTTQIRTVLAASGPSPRPTPCYRDQHDHVPYRTLRLEPSLSP